MQADGRLWSCDSSKLWGVQRQYFWGFSSCFFLGGLPLFFGYYLLMMAVLYANLLTRSHWYTAAHTEMLLSHGLIHMTPLILVCFKCVCNKFAWNRYSISLSRRRYRLKRFGVESESKRLRYRREIILCSQFSSLVSICCFDVFPPVFCILWFSPLNRGLQGLCTD